MDEPILILKITLWRGRKVKDDLSACVLEGFMTASWDTWVDAKKGKS